LCLCKVARFLGVARGKRALPGELRPHVSSWLSNFQCHSDGCNFGGGLPDNPGSQVSYSPVLYGLSMFCCFSLCKVAGFLGVARGKRALPGELRPP